MDFPRPIPFLQHLGCELQRFDSGHAVIALVPQPNHTNSFGMVHGGVLMTLMDAAMAHAARSTEPASADPAAGGVVTIEMKTMFMRPAVGAVRVHGRVLHRTGSMAFCEATAWVVRADEGETAAAQATGTFRYMPAERGRALVARAGVTAPADPAAGGGSD